MIINRFVGFIGNVVNIDGVDANFGKVQIRILGDQGEAVIQDEDLLWATLMMPITSPAERGIGTTPNWLVVGTTVVGYFLDGVYRNMPMIVGTINQDKRVGPSISPLASGENIPRDLTAFEKDLGVQSARKPNYNNNKVITTASKEEPGVINHIIEIDDTLQSERILVKHKSGAYVEFLPNGTVVVKSVNVIGVKGNNDIKLDTDKALKIRSNQTVEIASDGGVVISGGGLLAEGLVGSLAGASGVFITPDGKTVTVLNGLITNIR